MKFKIAVSISHRQRLFEIEYEEKSRYEIVKKKKKKFSIFHTFLGEKKKKNFARL